MKGSDLRKLLQAIDEAFDLAEFDMVLKLDLDFDRKSVVADGPRRLVVFQVLQRLDERGSLGSLLTALAKERPDHPGIQECYQEYVRVQSGKPSRTDVDPSVLEGAKQGGLTPGVDPRNLGEGAPPPADTAKDGPRARLEARGVPFTVQSLLEHIQSGNPEIVRLLLEAGLESRGIVQGRTALEWALEAIPPVKSSSAREDGGEATEVLRVLLEASGPSGTQGVIAHRLLEEGCESRLRALVQAGLPLDSRGPAGVPFFAALSRKDEDRLETWRTSSSPFDSSRSDDRPELWTEALLRVAPRASQGPGAWLLLWAARQDVPEVIERLLALKCPADARLGEDLPNWPLTKSELKSYWPGGTALHLAAARGNSGLVNRLVRAGADANAADREASTPLHRAARLREDPIRRILVRARRAEGPAGAADDLTRDEQAYAVVRFLLQNGASPDRTNAAGETALEQATDFPELANLLLQAGARANLDRALHRAVARHSAKLIPALVRAGADVNSRDQDGRTPLHWLCCFWHEGIDDLGARCVECLGTLLDSGADVSLRDADGRTPLHYAADSDVAAAVRELLRRGAEPNVLDAQGFSPLMAARSREVAETLLAHEADPGLRDGSGFTAGDHATRRGRAEVIAVVKSAGSAVGPRPEAELLRACALGDEQAIRALIQAGASSNCVGPCGHRPLTVAVHSLEEAAIAALLQLGADPDGHDPDGWTPVGAALVEDSPSFLAGTDARGRLERITRLLVERGAKLKDVDGRGSDGAFFGYWWWRRDDFASWLLQQCDPAGVNWRRESLLMVAVQRGSRRHVRYLLGRGAEVDARDGTGQTALFHTAGVAEPSLIDEAEAKCLCLIEAGADVNAADDSGLTPLMVAAQTGATAMARLLTRRGADPRRRDAHGLTARDWALQRGDADLVNMLGGS